MSSVRMHPSGHTLYSTLDNLSSTAQALINYADRHRVWLLEGAMGAGKTTLIRALCARLGVQDNVTSPTFSLVQEYVTASGEPIYHFDFYRIGHEEEALELDCTAYFESGSYCFIEWPTQIPNLLPAAYCKVSMTAQPDASRVVYINVTGTLPCL